MNDQLDWKVINTPVSDWRCELFGITGTTTFQIFPAKGGEPNWFWRWMQFVCFGNRWIRK